MEGPIGPSGADGKPGEPGNPGADGKCAVGNGVLFARHSQTTSNPSCPVGTKKVWDGFSFMYMSGNDHAHFQDLGSAGSCLRTFSTMPYLYCSLNKQCRFASRGDQSYWLTTDASPPMDMRAVRGADLEQYVSRCSVCEADTNVMAVHSQDTFEPECPNEWSELWAGYSFLQYTGKGKTGGGTDLSSPGSCLESFRASPFMECYGRGTCDFYHNAFSFWLSTIEEELQFANPSEMVMKAGNLNTHVSRCKVCKRNPSCNSC